MEFYSSFHNCIFRDELAGMLDFSTVLALSVYISAQKAGCASRCESSGTTPGKSANSLFVMKVIDEIA